MVGNRVAKIVFNDHPRGDKVETGFDPDKGNVIIVRQDDWVELRRVGDHPLYWSMPKEKIFRIIEEEPVRDDMPAEE